MLSVKIAIASLVVALAACNHTPSEPDAPAKPAETSALPPLAWTAPGTWSPDATQVKGVKKAAYKTAPAGSAKEGATVEVFFFGTGAPGDPEPHFKELYTQFDGDVGASAVKDSFEVHGMQVETREVAGTFKIDLGPKGGPQKRAPAQMVKKDYRLIAAVVKTPDRGNWFFKMVGPEESVQSARSSFHELLESVR